MKKILNKIEKQLKGFNENEKQEVLNYYIEIINDRLDNGEDIDNIDQSINYGEIRKIHLLETINKRLNKTVKESTKTVSNLLGYLFTSILWFPLGIVYLLVVFSIYLTIFCLSIAMIILPFAFIAIPIDLVVNNVAVGNVLLTSGAVLLVITLIEYGLFLLNRLLLKINNGAIKFFSKIVLKKGDK